jgi:hypothetical protein
MSTFVMADSKVLFESLVGAFEQIAREYEVVIAAKIFNACPKVRKD